MKRTISQVIDLIKEKIDNCEKDGYTIHNTKMGLLEKTNKISELFGVKQAYTDILALLESSHLVEQEKSLKIIKKKIVIHKYKNERDYYGYFTYYTNLLTKEEYDNLSEVFKDEK